MSIPDELIGRLRTAFDSLTVVGPMCREAKALGDMSGDCQKDVEKLVHNAQILLLSAANLLTIADVSAAERFNGR